MPASTDRSSMKSSSLSSKAASLQKSVKKGVKVLARPFKKLKTSISVATRRSSQSIRSQSTGPGNEDDDIDDGRSSRSILGSQENDDEPLEPSPQDQLGKFIYLF